MISFIFVSCEKEELNENIESNVARESIAKRSRGNSAVISFQDHQDMLKRNSFIIGEIIRLSPSDESYIRNSLDPVTNTVSMNTLFNGANSTSFVDNYKAIGTFALADYYGCRDSNETVTTPDTSPWPPRDPDDDDPLGRFSGNIVSQEVLDLIDKLVLNNTEIVINNPGIREDILIVGHPLTSSLAHLGYLIYNDPIFTHTVIRRGQIRSCALYSQEVNIEDSDLASDNLIILSRPNLDNGNPYSYINFDIKNFLQDLDNGTTSGPYLGGS